MFRLINRSRIYLAAGCRKAPSGLAKDTSYSSNLFVNHRAAPAQIAIRTFSNQEDGTPRRRLLPPLMEMRETIWPSLLNSIRGFVFLHFIIRPYLDNDFNVKDFTTGAKQAVHVISTKLSNGDFDGLTDIVAEDIVPELKRSLSKMTVGQRAELAIRLDDIYLAFPYQVRLRLSSVIKCSNRVVFAFQIGIIFDEANEKLQRRIVEITMVFHTIKGLQEILHKGEQIPMNLK